MLRQSILRGPQTKSGSSSPFWRSRSPSWGFANAGQTDGGDWISAKRMIYPPGAESPWVADDNTSRTPDRRSASQLFAVPCLKLSVGQLEEFVQFPGARIRFKSRILLFNPQKVPISACSAALREKQIPPRNGSHAEPQSTRR